MPLVSLLITLIILGLVLYLLWWAVNLLPLPAPFKVAAQVVVILIAIIVLLEYVLPEVRGGLVLR